MHTFGSLAIEETSLDVRATDVHLHGFHHREADGLCTCACNPVASLAFD